MTVPRKVHRPALRIGNDAVADQFEQLADLLDIEGANTFRIRAYRNAARTIRGHPRSLQSMISQHEDLTQLPGIGADLAGKIATIITTGRLPLLDQIERRTPAGLRTLLRVEGLGPKRVAALHDALGVTSIEDLQRAIRSGRLGQIRGFGKRTIERLTQALERAGVRSTRTKLRDADRIAAPLVAHLEGIDGIKSVLVAGSVRRRKDTVGDIDIVVTARRDSQVIERFLGYEDVADIIARGTTRCSVRLTSGLSVDLRLVPQVSFGAAACYFTGSKAHVIAMRQMAMKKKLKINEYGIFKGRRRIAGRTEAEMYQQMGLDYIEPELREDRGEIEAAKRHTLPRLVTSGDVRGDLHCHSLASDGRSSLAEIARKARTLGHEYVAINDHSKGLKIAHGLDERALLRQIKEIDRLNAHNGGCVLLKSIEVEILEDGTLDLHDDVLSELDFTIGAVHSKFGLSRDDQTERIVRAMDNPHFNVLAHPTGRLINEREPYDIDLETILRAARERGCMVELNAHPERLDLDDSACRLAKSLDVKVALGSDAHAVNDLDLMRFGVDQARRGWLEPDDIANTRSLDELTTLFKRC